MGVPLEDDRLQRYFDGDLPEAEAEEVSESLEVSKDDAQRLEKLQALHGLFQDAEWLSEPLSGPESESLFAAIEARLDSEDGATDSGEVPALARPAQAERQSSDAPALGGRPSAAPKRQSLRAIEGGKRDDGRALQGSGPPTRPETWRVLVPAAIVLAAAAAFILVLQPGPSSDGSVAVVDPETAADVQIEEPQVTLVEAPNGSEVVEYDFGQNIGTVFEVEGAAGEPIAVVWISDDAASL